MESVDEILYRIVRKNGVWDYGTVAVADLEPRERSYFAEKFPWVKSAVVLGRHITTVEEWTWRISSGGQEHCPADDRAAEVCCIMKRAFETHGCKAEIVSYPGESGLLFRAVAKRAGLGEIGVSAFLLHKKWGPWIHLRVLATDAPAENGVCVSEGICTACNLCLSACPARAITEGSFNGIQCRVFREESGEYIPYGPDRILRYCTLCAKACSLGQTPVG